MCNLYYFSDSGCAGVVRASCIDAAMRLALRAAHARGYDSNDLQIGRDRAALQPVRMAKDEKIDGVWWVEV